jgi:adenylate cyclase
VPVQPVERKLAAIFAADIVGYSRLMARDEVGTLARLKACRVITDELIASHRGRIFNTAGDSVVADFASAVDAVRCAVAVQAAIVTENAGDVGDEPMQFRIGVHVGDIMVDGENLLGDGVNIAARLESLADPGAICVSAAARDHIGNKLPLTFDDLGDQLVKNLAQPIRVYRVQTETPVFQAVAALPLPDKPSIAVLAFANLSSDPEQEFFADGVAEDIITALSRYPSLFVIARNSSFSYKGRSVDVKQIGRDLGVRYVLEGSLRKAGSQIRVTAQLIEADSGNHLWAERYDRDLSDIFAVQDEITAAVTIAVAPAIDAAERRRALRRPSENLDAWAAYQQGMWYRAKADPAANDQARNLFERAAQLDPMFAAAYAGLARAYGYATMHHRTIPMAEGLRQNLMYARKAIELDPSDADAQAELAYALTWQGDIENGLASARQAISLNPNCASAHILLGAGLIFTGRTVEGRAALTTAERLSPRDENHADDVN